MRQLISFIKNEMVKLTKQKKYILLPIIAAFCTAGCAALGLIPGSVIKFSMQNYPYTVLSALCYVFIPLAAFMSAADLFSGEEERGELRISFMRPVSRYVVLIGKLIAIILYCAVCVVGLTVVSTAISFIGGAAVNVLSVLLSLLVTLIPIFMLASMGVLVSTFIHTATGSFVLCLIGFGAFIVVGFALSFLATALPTGYLTLYKLTLGSAPAWRNFLMGVTILLGYGTVFISLASMRFAKKEM